jgi:hypothetical protein
VWEGDTAVLDKASRKARIIVESSSIFLGEFELDAGMFPSSIVYAT